MTNTRLLTQEMMKQQTWGAELEFYGISMEKGARLVSQFYYGDPSHYQFKQLEHDGYTLNAYSIIDPRGREWYSAHDGSLRGDSNSGELITPVMRYEDIEEYQRLIRTFREAGAKSGGGDSTSGGIHIHVGADIGMAGGHTPQSLRNLINLMASREKLLIKAFKVSSDRMVWYTKTTAPRLLEMVNTARPTTMAQLKTIWYEGNGYREIFTAHRNHYHDSRYHFLNLHPIFLKTLAGTPQACTVEFRFYQFHGLIHAGEMKSFIQLSLAMSAYAKVVRTINPAPIEFSHNERFVMRNWLNNMGLIGDEFKTLHKMLTKRLTGDSSYRNGRPRTDSLDDLYLVG